MSESKRSGGEMSAPQLIQQLALLNWLQTDSVESKAMLTAVTGAQVAKEVLDRLTGQSKVDAYRRECILSVAEFVKSNPRASQAELTAAVEERVRLFAVRVQELDSAPLL
ncbi:hypothetical protein AAFF_G00280770 [Aldrovandia affinis]|uniref:Uncharacterized protein n=1 Tax=Aldrovandia affinis TaxID=143900 RepID=A0AAD7RAK7_9TELE|nr:hypothetical protein AAFF_G00280770 [Aldrovandia affinis]